MSVDRETRPFAEFRDFGERGLAPWRKEAADIVRDVFGRRADAAEDGIRVDIHPESVSAFAITTGRIVQLGIAAWARPDDLALLAHSVQQRAKVLKSGNDATLRFSQDLVFRLPLDLPKARASVLKKAALCELERLNPLPPDALYVDWWESTAVDPTRSHVELRAVRRTIADEALALCRSWGLSVCDVEFENDARKAHWWVFPLDRPALARSRWRQHGIAMLSVLTLVLFAGLALSVYARLSIEADRMIAQAELENEQAMIVHRLEHDIAKMRLQYDFASAQKRAPLAIATLNTLSRTLPDNTWLTRVDLKGSKAQIEGFSKSPSDVVSAIDQSPSFANAEFAAPLEGAPDGSERFEMTFDIKQEAPR